MNYGHKYSQGVEAESAGKAQGHPPSCSWAEILRVISSNPSGDKTWKGSPSAIQYNYIKKKILFWQQYSKIFHILIHFLLFA